MPKPAEIVFSFDYISPYAWIAWRGVQQLAAEFGALVRPNPVLFAALLNHHGQKGPAEIPSKRLYTFVDVLRKAQATGVELNVPHTHPFNPLRALRATMAESNPAAQANVVQALFEAVWVNGADVSSQGTFENLGLAALWEAAERPDIKSQLRDATAAALGRGIFGVPTVEIDGEMFWGVDSLPFLRRHLAGDRPDPSAKAKLARWRALAASAKRT